MRCPSYRTASERGTAWNKHYEGPSSSRLCGQVMAWLTSAAVIPLFSAFCCRRESEHDQMVRSIYEDTDSQIREEREKRSAQVRTCVDFRVFGPWAKKRWSLQHLNELFWIEGTHQTKAERGAWGGAEDPGSRFGEHPEQTERGRRPNTAASYFESLMSHRCFPSLSWSPESSSWARSKQTSRRTMCSSAASTCSCRSRWSTAGSSCRLLWRSSARCSTALSRSKWTNRGEKPRPARPENRWTVACRCIWARRGTCLIHTRQTGLKSRSFACLLFFFWDGYKRMLQEGCSGRGDILSKYTIPSGAQLWSLNKLKVREV